MPKVAEGYLEARRQSIVAAASRVFSQKGVEAATMAEIAREAGISPGAIYRYFESKAALAVGCFNERAQPILSQWSAEPTPGTEPLGFRDLCLATIRLLDETGEDLSTILDLEHTMRVAREGDPVASTDLRALQENTAADIRARVEAGVAGGELPASVDPDVLAHFLLSLWWGFRVEKLQNPDLDLEPQIDLLLRFIECAGSGPAK